MKKLHITFYLLFLALSLNAQKSKIYSWDNVTEVPKFPGCEEEIGNENLSQCFEFRIAAHILKNFEYPEIAQNMGIEGIVKIEFVIDEMGKIQDLKTFGPDSVLENEAIRIINLLPIFIPAKGKRNKAVSVKYSIPLTFKLDDND